MFYFEGFRIRNKTLLCGKLGCHNIMENINTNTSLEINFKYSWLLFLLTDF